MYILGSFVFWLLVSLFRKMRQQKVCFETFCLTFFAFCFGALLSSSFSWFPFFVLFIACWLNTNTKIYDISPGTCSGTHFAYIHLMALRKNIRPTAFPFADIRHISQLCLYKQCFLLIKFTWYNFSPVFPASMNYFGLVCPWTFLSNKRSEDQKPAIFPPFQPV